MISVLEKIIDEFESKKFIEKNNNRDRGVIYTPQPIADYMVRNTFKIFFGKFPEIQKIFQKNCDSIILKEFFVENKNIKYRFETKIRNIKVLDPACGTGRFLIAAAKFLFKIYKALDLKCSDQKIKRKIIQNHLYGIEIDESAYVISKIRLISWIYSDIDASILDESIDINSDLGKIKEFVNNLDVKFNICNIDYLLQFNSTDFDIIIGNPPYVENKKILDLEFKQKIKKKFESAYGLYDLSIVFIEKSIELLKNGVGCLSFITTNKFLSADYGLKIRELMIRKTELKEIINISSLPIFHKTAAYPVIISFKKSTSTENIIIIKNFEILADFEQFHDERIIAYNQNLIKNLPSAVIPISQSVKLVNQMYTNFKPMKSVIKDLKILYRPFGFINWAENFKNISKNKTSNKDLLLIGTGNVGRFYIDHKKHIKIAKKNQEITYFRFQSEYKEVWDKLSNEKIIFREIAKDITCVYDPGVYVNLTGLYFLNVPSFKTDDYFCLLTILNSALIDLVFKTLYGTLHMSGGYLRFNGSFIKNIPLPNKFPLTLSHIGKVLQFLYQLKYETLQGSNFQLENNTKLKDILNHLNFYEKLSNSLVNQLYLHLEHYDELNKVLYSSNLFPNVEFKFMNSLYELPRYDVYEKGEVEEILNHINKSINILSVNSKLIKQMNKILTKQL